MTGDLEARIRVLEDIEAIKKLKYRMTNYVDTRNWTEAIECFSDKARIEVPGVGTAAGREEVAKFHLEVLPKNTKFTKHYICNPEIEITGENTATGRWYGLIADTSANNEATWGSLTYKEEYVKENGVWKYSSFILQFDFRSPYEEGWAKASWLEFRG